MLVAPQLFLDVNFMGGVLVYSFAAATLGGFDSPKGAVIGGWIIGVAETLAGDYIGFIGSDLTILVPLAIIFGVLLVRAERLVRLAGGGARVTLLTVERDSPRTARLQARRPRAARAARGGRSRSSSGPTACRSSRSC